MNLVAVGRRLDSTFDLNDIAAGDGVLFVRDGVGFAGRGAVAVASASEVSAELADVRVVDDLAHPVAIGSIPFRAETGSKFVIPELIVEKSANGETVATAVSTDELSARAVLAGVLDHFPNPAPATVGSATFTVAPLTPVETYLVAVAAARDAVRSGSITKAVIARDILVTCDRAIDVRAVLLRLKASFGSSYRYSFDNFIGASPELLVSVHDGVLRSHPLAGTTARTGDPTADQRLAAALLASEKNQIEHRVVVDMVHDTLLPFCSYLDWEAEPSVVAVANVQHLGTRVEGRLNAPMRAIDLAVLLSPTPALGGYPRDAAVRLIEQVEGMDRGRYGGTIGWCDAQGNGTFAVAIRCAQFDETRMTARLFAGGGIVADSEPEAELAETQAKFQAMLSAIVRP